MSALPNLAHAWVPGSEQAELPPRLGETFGDKFADRFPTWCWPKVRILYYVYSGSLMLLVLYGMSIMLTRRGR
jgi:hypothetical protein